MAKIAYRFETPIYPGNILYLNLVSGYACTNRCLFCSKPDRKGVANIYEKKAGTSLYLERVPTLKEVMIAVDEKYKERDEELAIIGLGEPLINLPLILDVIKAVKAKYDLKVRIDTNGTAGCIYEDPAKKLAEAGLDMVRISLNAVNAEDYAELCRSRFENAFVKVVSFVRDCIAEGIDTQVSFVIGFEKSKTSTEYKAFAKSLGVKKLENVILRPFIPSISK